MNTEDYECNQQVIESSFLSDSKAINQFEKDDQKKKYFLVKDNFWSAQFPTTASSNFLSSFSTYRDATVIKILRRFGFKLLGKSFLDEFACGGTGLFTNQIKLVNPYHSKRIVGGSSSGSAWAVANEIVEFSLAHDTGDSIRRPSSYCGVIGFKPSYGLVSRYGIIPMASSLDTVGIIAKRIETIENIFSKIKGSDYRDLVTISSQKKKKVTIHNQKEIIIIQGIERFLAREYQIAYLRLLDKIKKAGYTFKQVEIPEKFKKTLQSAYLVICSTELVSHLNSLQGITFGDSSSLSIEEKRTYKLGKQVKERIVLGNYFLENSQVIKKARILRGVVSDWINQLLTESAFFLFPGTQKQAPLIDSIEENLGIIRDTNWVDNLLLIANFSGNPSINLPIGTLEGMPISINIDCSWGNDQTLINFSKIIN